MLAPDHERDFPLCQRWPCMRQSDTDALGRDGPRLSQSTLSLNRLLSDESVVNRVSGQPKVFNPVGRDEEFAPPGESSSHGGPVIDADPMLPHLATRSVDHALTARFDCHDSRHAERRHGARYRWPPIDMVPSETSSRRPQGLPE